MGEFFDLTSLRGKIASAYAALVAATLVLAVTALLDLLLLERQIADGKVVSDLIDRVSEMRREEKNLFLYEDREALARADGHAASSTNILRRHQASLGEIIGRSEPPLSIQDLDTYRSKLASWISGPVDERLRVEDEIRALGHRLHLAVEALSKEERRMLQTAIDGSLWFLLIFLLIVGVAVYAVGHQLQRLAIEPLRNLESGLKSIAEGRFNRLQAPSGDRELTTFSDAFNRMLRELEIRQRRMLQSEKLASLGILASGVAHELNNPLSNISSSCQLLMEELSEAEPDQLNAWLKQIDTETERGRNIVRALLDFGSQRVFQKDRVVLVDLIDETKAIIGKTLRQYSAKLAVNVPADLTLEVDKQRILQLFINLIQNSLHAAGEGVQVRISAMACEPGVSMIPDGAEVAGNLKCITEYEGRFTEILIADDGPGIPAARLSKVFDPFFTSSEPGQGVGLGLSIVQEIVREHQGCLAIASRPGGGTQVIVLLPGEDSSRG